MIVYDENASETRGYWICPQGLVGFSKIYPKRMLYEISF